MAKIGPFFYIRGKLIYNACSLVEGREQAGKLDNPYGHDQLYDDHFKSGEYIDYPRGRVLWDEEKNHSIIYIDPCIHRDNVKLLIETHGKMCISFCFRLYTKTIV